MSRRTLHKSQTATNRPKASPSTYCAKNGTLRSLNRSGQFSRSPALVELQFPQSPALVELNRQLREVGGEPQHCFQNPFQRLQHADNWGSNSNQPYKTTEERDLERELSRVRQNQVSERLRHSRDRLARIESDKARWLEFRNKGVRSTEKRSYETHYKLHMDELEREEPQVRQAILEEEQAIPEELKQLEQYFLQQLEVEQKRTKEEVIPRLTAELNLAINKEKAKLLRDMDWECGNFGCGNINWPSRHKCQRCNTDRPPFQGQELLTEAVPERTLQVKICHSFTQSGRCKYGDSCRFAHVGDVAQPNATPKFPPAAAREKTPKSSAKLAPVRNTPSVPSQPPVHSVAVNGEQEAATVGPCFRLRDTGTCKRGKDCPFSHDLGPVLLPRGVCFDFKKRGSCQRVNCRYLHDGPMLVADAVAAVPKKAPVNECVVCFQEMMERFAVIPCGHTQTCQACLNALVASQSQCPICRGNSHAQ